jgi:hypothetical protein
LLSPASAYATQCSWAADVSPAVSSSFKYPSSAFQLVRIPRQVGWQEFQRHKAAQASVFRLVNHTHTAAAQLFQDAVMQNRFVNNAVPLWQVLRRE